MPKGIFQRTPEMYSTRRGRAPWNKGKTFQYAPRPNAKGGTPWNKGIRWVFTEEHRQHMRGKTGALCHWWRGDAVGLKALHVWIRKHLVKPECCSSCGKKTAYLDCANISQKYKRILSDWEWLCRRCHMTKDGRMGNLKQYKK